MKFLEGWGRGGFRKKKFFYGGVMDICIFWYYIINIYSRFILRSLKLIVKSYELDGFERFNSLFCILFNFLVFLWDYFK